ncbi:MAG: alpha/beta hydrolase [Thermoanaerobaculia bacterium]|nr:alpha/beta hydrolase [Thermoanaerobaculia bacterium]
MTHHDYQPGTAKPSDARIDHRVPDNNPRASARTWLKQGLVLLGLFLAVAQGSAQPLAEDVDAATLQVERYGTEGPAVILIPGLSCGGDVWDGTVAALRSEYRLFVVTLPGFAGTTPLAKDQMFLPTTRDMILDFLRSEGLERPAIIGHSLGAHLAYALAIAAPEAIGPIVAVDGLPFLGALQDPSATAETTAPIAEQMRAMFENMTAEQFSGQNELALRSMIRDPKEIERIQATSRLSDPKTVGKAMAELMVSDLRVDLQKIQSPILQLGAFGGLPTDDLREIMGTRYKNQIGAAAQARFAVAPTLHFVMLDDLDFFLGVVSGFLEESH